MKNRSVKKMIHIVITVSLVVLVLFCGYRMMIARMESEAAESAYSGLARMVGAQADSEEVKEAIAVAVAQEEYPPLDIDIATLKEMNEDFRGWLYFPAVEISYPVVQAEDNDYYIHRSFEGEKLSAGCIFMDCEASSDWSDRNTFVFGHNMRDDSMFGNLKLLMKDPSLIQDNKYFYIYTEEFVYTYEVFACYLTQATSDRYMTFTSDENYDLYVDWAIENTVIKTEADLNARGNIVSLSTCHGSAGTSRRLLVHGVLIRTEPNK